MSAIPDFGKIGLKASAQRPAHDGGDKWETPEGIGIKPV